MAQMTGVAMMNHLTNMAGVRRWGLVVGCLAILAFSPFPSSAWGGFACEDLNNNGTCDPGVDNDITAALTTDGSYSTSESIVVAAGKGFTTKSVDGFSLVAGKNIAISAGLSALAKGANIILLAQETVTVSGTNTTLRAGERGTIYIEAGQNIYAGPTRTSMSAKFGAITLYAWAGDILFEQSRLIADDIEVYASEGGVTALNSTFDTKPGDTRVDAATDVIMNGNWVMAELTGIRTAGSLIDFRNNSVKASRGGSVILSTQGSTVDIRGTKFMNVDSDSVIIDAQTVLQ